MGPKSILLLAWLLLMLNTEYGGHSKLSLFEFVIKDLDTDRKCLLKNSALICAGIVFDTLPPFEVITERAFQIALVSLLLVIILLQ